MLFSGCSGLFPINLPNPLNPLVLNSFIDPNRYFASLPNLISIGLVGSTENGTYYFNPATKESETLTRQLLTAYQTRRVEVVEFIFTKKHREVLSFSEAFKIKRDKHGK